MKRWINLISIIIIISLFFSLIMVVNAEEPRRDLTENQEVEKDLDVENEDKCTNSTINMDENTETVEEIYAGEQKTPLTSTGENELKTENGEELVTEENITDEGPSIEYQTHLSKLGWQDVIKDGMMAGTVGQNLPMEALAISVKWNGHETESYGVEYETHVAEIGWQKVFNNGEIGGTTGRAKALEAIKIRLTGKIAEQYDIYYRVHSAEYGWFDWAKNGELSGSVGYGYAMQAIEIRLYSKDSEEKPVTTERTYLAEDNMGKIIYSAHVQEVGWQKKVADGAIAGTTGKGLGIEALAVTVSNFGRNNNDLSGSVKYQAHVSGVGWQSEVENGVTAGTTGENRRIEAVRLYLTEELESTYDVYYRVHSSNFGWLGWTKNGGIAGSTGYGSAVESIQIELFQKDSPEAPLMTDRSSLSREDISPIDIQEHIAVNGWQTVKNGTDLVAGTTGQNKGIEAIAMAVKPQSSTYLGGILYNAHISGLGWQGWKSDGNIAGTVGQARNLEAIQIKLSGDMEKYCDIYYRAHVSEFGWLGWAKNGESAGSSGYAYKLQAIEVKIFPKYTSAPGDTSNAFKQAPPSAVSGMLMRANLYGSTTPYLILVDRSIHKVGVFQGWQGNWNNLAFWDCSDGAPSSPTVEGVFKVGIRGNYFDSGTSRCYWYTQFYGNYLFHSVLYNKYTGALADGRLGMALSHGCVRLDINNAKWIYSNIPSGTTVVVYH